MNDDILRGRMADWDQDWHSQLHVTGSDPENE